jgi:Ca-activated chloride channel family protein
MTAGNIVLMHPGWLWLLPALIIAALLWHHILGRDDSISFTAGMTRNISLIHPLLHLIPRRESHRGQRMLMHTVLWLVLACLVLALSQPVRIGKQLPQPPRERDIVFIVDTSLSMILRDYVMNGQRIERINLLKNLLNRFVQRLQGERIAVVVFGETAHTLVPLTRDQQLLTTMISRISAGMVKRHNAVGDAIALSVREASQDKHRRRILVLFTDAGEDTGSVKPRAAAQLAAEAGLPLYTIAIGAGTAEAKEQRQYSGLLYQTVDLALLKSLADTTGAHSYQASDSQALEQAVADISRQEENTATHQRVYYARHPLYMWPLLLGLGLITLYQFARIPEKTRL